MKRMALSFITPLVATALIASTGFAHPVEKDEKSKSEPVQALLQIKPLSQSEIKKIENNMPNMNGMLRDMVRLANDEDIREHFENGMRRMDEKLDIEQFMDMGDGMPDLNGMMGAMLSLMGDEEFIDEISAGIEPLAVTMEKYLPED